MFRRIVLYIIKLLLTPFLLIFLAVFTFLLLLKMFADWLLDVGSLEQAASKRVAKDLYDFIKEWFTL